MGGLPQPWQDVEGLQLEVPSPPIHTKGVGGHIKFCCLSRGWFHMERQAKALLFTPYGKDIALHNMSYKGHVNL
jgi:hypothetical protein